MVPLKQSWTTPHHPRNISLLLPLCWSTIHEESKAFPAEKHINRLQHRTNRAKRRSGYRGEFRPASKINGRDGEKGICLIYLTLCDLRASVRFEIHLIPHWLFAGHFPHRTRSKFYLLNLCLLCFL